MTDNNDPIESYLDEMLLHLRGSPRMVRRILSETEAHLRDAIADGLSASDAIARFGTARDVAQANNRSAAVPVPVLLRQLTLALGALCVVGLLAIGASGVLAGGMDAAFGAKFVAGDLPTNIYTPARCSDYRALAPDQSTCLAAAARHHTNEVESGRIAAGVLGLIGAGVLAILRRRWRATPMTGALAPGLVPAIGASVFVVAAVALTVQSSQGFAWRSSSGVGQWLSAAVVSTLVSVGFGVRWLREARSPRLAAP